MADERRASPRVPLDVTVNCGQKGFAQAQDISEGGLCLIVEEALPEGKMIHVSLSLPDQEKEISGYAKVMWCRRAMTKYHRAGLQFWDFKEEDKKAILLYLSQPAF